MVSTCFTGENETFDQAYIQADCSSGAYQTKKFLVYEKGILVHNSEPKNDPVNTAKAGSVIEGLIREACSLY